MGKKKVGAFLTGVYGGAGKVKLVHDLVDKAGFTGSVEALEISSDFALAICASLSAWEVLKYSFLKLPNVLEGLHRSMVGLEELINLKWNRFLFLLRAMLLTAARKLR